MTGMIGPLELSLEELEGTRAEAPVPSVAEAPTAEVASLPHRNPLPAHLPRERVEHPPEAEDCPSCGGELKRLREEVSEQLEYVPTSFRGIRRMRPKFACTQCDTIVQAPASDRAQPGRGRSAGARARDQIRRSPPPISAK